MNKGFTLLEMAISVGIILIISALILADFPYFFRRLELSRTAQAIAFSFREAEANALAVREFGSGIFPAYGLHFENPPAKSYILFADVNGDRAYNAPAELADTFFIQNLPSIVQICAGAKSSPPGDCSINKLDVVFVRPNPDIIISADEAQFTDAEIIIKLPDGTERRIVVWQTGQISIE
jgi:prepilin-type N-terminal cleavage/methylation domain-containing protein